MRPHKSELLNYRLEFSIGSILRHPLCKDKRSKLVA